MIQCRKCAASPAKDPTVTLIRQNPKKEIGVWECLKCNEIPIDAEVKEIITAIQGD